MKKIKLLAFVAILAGFGAMTASAAIVMKVNTANNTFSFEGTDTGNGQYYGYQNHYEVNFKSKSSGTWMGGSPNPVNLELAFPGVPEPSLIIYADEGIGLGFSSGENGSDITTITAVSTETFDYSTWNESSQTALENAIGDTMTLSTGSGYSSIAIQAIPEPATMGLIALLSGSILAVRRIFSI